MLYRCLRPFLFLLDPETAHRLTLSGINFLHSLGLLRPLRPLVYHQPCTVMGLTFKNAVGLAAGLDKNGEYIDSLADLGFGFIEVGTVTPRPQGGNPRPRLFRLPPAAALINRMGFNNDGVDKLIENLQQTQYGGVLGISIGKNAVTPLEKAADDYLVCLEKVYSYASYVAINLSSPNTQHLRRLQGSSALPNLLHLLKKKQTQLAKTHGRYVPILIKIAPDFDERQIVALAKQLRHYQVDGVIATNTSVDHTAVQGFPHGHEMGGISGAPLCDQANWVIQVLADALEEALPIIGVGGIMTAEHARQKRQAGAKLVQLYTGLIYTGPRLIQTCVRAWGHDSSDV